MSSVRYGTRGGEEVPLGQILMERDGESASRRTTVPVREGGGPGAGRVLDFGDRTAYTVVFVLHEETVNQYPGMAFFGGMFVEEGVSVRAMEHGVVAPFPVRATLDLAGQWKIMGFTRYSISQVVLFCI
jgi:hypothetical protein